MIRRLRALFSRRNRAQPAGLEALFTTPPACPDPLLKVSWLDPSDVGRQASWGAAIHETVAWLEANGFADVGRGDLQRYAAFLLERRAAYERGAEVPS